ncbi:RNA 3'-terminal phosphate cyclase [Gynuella sunshinyii YC6258]|uniref:RNA 3'-terminal phosphate cyclase n=2 Tax=Gynuella sunshinyii TaxID=1445505 RepID=A0A0C5VE79_9GAMM|nr:RNA 3'-terminal phosphate cyclase [Gynuella sunshinyii YC6258]
MDMIELDGRQGEGGGQILRSALTLAMLTGKGIEIHHIRGGRPKPGLMRQHLTCVLAAQTISGAWVEGAELGSTRLRFVPGAVTSGDYHFDVGSAGSTTLVFQTIALPLLQAKGASTVQFRGGTHNPMAPPLTYLKRSFLPLLREMGAQIELDVQRWGFMPAGGGCWQATIKPSVLSPISRLQRGELLNCRLSAYEVGLSNQVAERELQVFCRSAPMAVTETRIRQPKSSSPGNLLAVDLHFEKTRICLTELGRPRLSAEKVAGNLLKQVNRYLQSDAVLDEYLADQIMLPMLVAGGGEFRCDGLSDHGETNRQIIARVTGREMSFQDHILRL